MKRQLARWLDACALPRVLVVPLLALMLAFTPASAAPPLDVPDEPLGIPGAGLPVNYLLNFAVTYEDAGAAYREPYRATRRYDGYFNPRLCYRYPLKEGSGAAQPDLDERTGYFSPAGPADAKHECRGEFSGNFLNWASMSSLDLLRHALTGGDRVIDAPGLTVLQRAWLPDGATQPNFYADAKHFPRKVLPAGDDASLPVSVTPFATERLFMVSCRNRLLFSNTGAGKHCDEARLDSAGRRLTSDKFFGEFNLRVQVCTPDDAVLRPSLCASYGQAYKPQGMLQTARQPIGVMGYLSELQGLGTAEYGGALRAPLKRLAPLAGGEAADLQGARSAPEWDLETGVLFTNPDRAGGGLSGAINYINRLGRTHDKRRGAYPLGDPGAELYYEALRYLQGRPSSLAAGGALDDGMPIWRTPADPILQACQRNIVATIGHGAFSADRFVPGNTITSGGDAARPPDRFSPKVPLDVMEATRRVGELEAASGGEARGLDTHAAGPKGTGSYYLAGTAWWAHTNAIRLDKPVRVDSHALELGASVQSPASVLFYAAKYGAFNDRNGDGNPNITSAPGASEWADADGKPRHYHRAAGPDDIVAAVRALGADMTTSGGWRPGASVVGGAGDARYLVQTSYQAGQWTGSVQRRALRIAADGTLDIATTPAWDAAEILSGSSAPGKPNAPLPPPAERAIYTFIRPADGPGRTIAFRWSELPLPERALFTRIGDGEARVNYLRGERSGEATGSDGSGLRRRGGVLGDIVRSTPLIVGGASASIQDAGYAAFHERARARRATVYVGANDGMLHAFDAATGRELFAYIPNALLPALPALTRPDYRHRAYVDGSPGHGEAQVRGRWRTVLASGMGMGARGLFALDVTEPAAFASGIGALWEFTERDDPAIGHIHAPPRIVKLSVSGKDGVPDYRYFVVASSGINPAGGEGRGALFVLALDKPPEQAWQLGLNYYKFVTPAAAADMANALSPVTLATAGDGAARYAYAGDLQGQLWRFDLSGKPPWGGTLGKPLFVARDAFGIAQPIAHVPALVFAPGGGYLALFATGKFIERADAASASFTPQSFYAVHDRLQPIKTPIGRAMLEARTLSGRGPFLVSGKPLSYSGPDARQGWYVDFSDTASNGERAGGPAVVAAGAVMFDTLLPGADGCGPPGRRSYLVDALSGMALGHDGTAQPDAFVGQVVLSDDSIGNVFDPPQLVGIGGQSGARHASGSAMHIRSYAIVRPGAATKAGGSVQVVKVASVTRRLSWRQVVNWKDLHDRARK